MSSCVNNAFPTSCTRADNAKRVPTLQYAMDQLRSCVKQASTRHSLQNTRQFAKHALQEPCVQTAQEYASSTPYLRSRNVPIQTPTLWAIGSQIRTFDFGLCAPARLGMLQSTLVVIPPAAQCAKQTLTRLTPPAVARMECARCASVRRVLKVQTVEKALCLLHISFQSRVTPNGRCRACRLEKKSFYVSIRALLDLL